MVCTGSQQPQRSQVVTKTNLSEASPVTVKCEYTLDAQCSDQGPLEVNESRSVWRGRLALFLDKGAPGRPHPHPVISGRAVSGARLGL